MTCTALSCNQNRENEEIWRSWSEAELADNGQIMPYAYFFETNKFTFHQSIFFGFQYKRLRIIIFFQLCLPFSASIRRFLSILIPFFHSCIVSSYLCLLNKLNNCHLKWPFKAAFVRWRKTNVGSGTTSGRVLQRIITSLLSCKMAGEMNAQDTCRVNAWRFPRRIWYTV